MHLLSLARLITCRLAHLIITLTLGWPLYLICNVASRPYPRFASHFDPWSPIFRCVVCLKGRKGGRGGGCVQAVVLQPYTGDGCSTLPFLQKKGLENRKE